MEKRQLKHHEINYDAKPLTLVDILLERVNSPANLGSIFRNAEAFGVRTLWIHSSNQSDLESNRFKRTSRSTQQQINFLFYNDYKTVFKNFKGTKVGLEITSDSLDINKWNGNKTDEVLLVLGNESLGISETILEDLDQVFHINMFGNNSSLNVAQTLGIALYEIRR